MASPKTAHPDYDPVYSTGPAAEYLDVHPKTLLKLRRQRKVAAVRTAGGRLKFRLSALNDYLDSLTVEPRSTRSTPQEIDWDL